jgi:lysophospholipase L1-like esterase
MIHAFRNAGLLCVSLLVAALLAELTLRVLAPIPYSMKVEYRPDGYVKQRLVPRRRYRLADGGTCTVNSAGYRGGEFGIPKPPGTFRIVALGGSSTFSYRTDDERIWTRELEKRLQTQFGGSVEVINAGVPGYSVFDSKIHYLYRVRALEPDALLVYHAWNDMKAFRRIEAGKPPRGSPFRPSLIRDSLRRFQIVWRVRSLIYRNNAGLPPREEGWVEEDPDDAITIPEGGRAHRWERSNYQDLALLANSDGALSIFVSQAGLMAEQNLDDAEVRRRVYTEYQGLDYREVLRQWHAIIAIQRGVAESHGAIFIDAYAAVPHSVVNFHDHVHLTPAGNEALAQVIFEGLANNAIFRARLSKSGALLGGRPEELSARAAEKE